MATAGIAAPASREAERGGGVSRALRGFLRAHRLVFERVLKVLSAWSADRCVSESAALGFFAAFSLAPMLVVVIAVAGFIFDADAVQGRLLSEIQSLMGKQGAEVVQAMVATAWKSGASGWIGFISVAGVVIGASATFSELSSAVNWIWRAPAPQGAVAALIKVRLLSFGLVLGTGFLAIVLLILDAALAFAGAAFVEGREYLTGPLVAAAQHVFTFVVLFGIFCVLLKVLPGVHVRWRDAGLGALVATLLFSIGKHFLAIYLAHAGTANAYGAAGSLAVVMMWLFFSAAVFLLGAEVAAHALPNSADPELKLPSESRAKKC